MPMNPSGSGAYLQGIGSVTAGQEVNTAMTMTVDSATPMTGANATWEVLDLDGFVWSQGNCGNVKSQLSPVNPAILQVTAEATIQLPGNMVANVNGSRYQVKYVLKAGNSAFTAFEQFIVLPPVQGYVGPIEEVLVLQATFDAKLVLGQQATEVTCAIWGGNGRITPDKPAQDAVMTQGGLLYKVPFKSTCDATHLVAIEPYSLMWNYCNGMGERCTETAELFIVNPIMVDMVRQVQSYINRAYVDSGIDPGTTFSTADCLKSLRYAQDQFNIIGPFTNFRLLNPQGQFRHFVVHLACVQAARAQALAEGMKAFNYGGQTITLDVDRTQYWETLANSLENTLHDDCIKFKTQLARRGLRDGDMSSLAVRSMGNIGLTLHAATPYRAGLIWGQNGSMNVPNVFWM